MADVGLPDIDGRELCRIARQRHPGLPVLLITGYGDAELADAVAPDEGIDALAKPFDIGALLTKVSLLLSRTP